MPGTLGMSYRTHFWSLVRTRSNMGTLRCRERPSLAVACWLSTRICSTCTPFLCGTGEVLLFYQKPGSVRQAHHRFGSCLPMSKNKNLKILVFLPRVLVLRDANSFSWNSNPAYRFRADNHCAKSRRIIINSNNPKKIKNKVKHCVKRNKLWLLGEKFENIFVIWVSK